MTSHALPNMRCSVTSTGAGTNGTAIRALADGDSATAISGWATHTTGSNTGIIGQTSSTNGNAEGVQGWSRATSGGASGVYGKADSVDGWGVYGFQNVAMTAVGSGGGVKGETWGSGAVAGLFANNATSTGCVALIAANNAGNTVSSNIFLCANATGSYGIFGAPTVFRVRNDGAVYGEAAYQSSGADFAELMDPIGKVDDFQPGDLLMIAVGGGGKVALASGAYTPLFAGVYSTRPTVVGNSQGVKGNELDLGKITVGLIGIVPTNVTMENGPITEGDLLVVSSTPGHAMRADPAKVIPGSVIGKALQSFHGDGDTLFGKINVLLGVK